jgi:ABC-2 family transporter protein
MIWFTWRQFRTQTWVALGALAVVGVLLAFAVREIAQQYAASGLAGCQVNCEALVRPFLRRLQDGVGGIAYFLSLGLTYAAPGLIGVFWGAPLIARELETGTVRLAWNQSVTRSRWLATKLLGVGALSVATAGLLSLATTWSLRTIDQVAPDGRITPALFGARGIVPIGYAVFAFALGVTLGLLIRRTVPAMAATLAIYVGAVVVMAQWVREHLAPVSHLTRALDTDHIDGLMIYGDNNTMGVIGEGELPGAWVLTNRTLTPSGLEFTGPPDPQYCGERAPGSCLDWVGTLGLRQDLTYHPAEQFWTLQLIETGIFVGLALALAGFCFWWLRAKRA